MAESLVERVARAMAQENDHHDEFEIGDFRDAYMDMARAAIEAMREPTDAMVDSGVDHIGEGHYNGWAYTAMIDAALNEQVSG